MYEMDCDHEHLFILFPVTLIIIHLQLQEIDFQVYLLNQLIIFKDNVAVLIMNAVFLGQCRR